MLFNSLQFILFYIIVTCLYFVCSKQLRWMLLLAASCYFYMVFVPKFILILGGTIVVDYIVGLWLENTEDKRAKKAILVISLIANVGVLAFFKYYNFLQGNLDVFFTLFGMHIPIPHLDILLPIGLSFHTFQAMSYTIEVYRGHQKAEKHFGVYALYVMFYPQLVAGPIERPQNVLHQFHEYYEYDWENMKSGLAQMAFGLFKKVVVADRLALWVDQAYASPQSQTGSGMIIACVFYSFQIYCDFSGYSDIGIGAARTMGYHLMDNFRAPYFARTISEFWSRWHISLSTWFRDYLYIPLGGNRVSKPRWYMNLMIVFLVSGLWHGAKWTFIIWGAIHGCYQVFGILKNSWLKEKNLLSHPSKVRNYLNIITTFLLVTIAWIFFRAPDFHVAKQVFGRLFSWSVLDVPSWGNNRINVLISFLLIGILMLKEKYYLIIPTGKTRNFALWFSVLLLCCYFFGVYNNKQFIYFQF